MVILPFTGEFVLREPGRQVGHRLARVNHAVTSLNNALVFGTVTPDGIQQHFAELR
jgi:hypothetical protein